MANKLIDCLIDTLLSISDSYRYNTNLLYFYSN